MDKDESLRGPETPSIEITKILHCLKNNGYEFKGTRDAIIGRTTYPNDVIANFEKNLSFSNNDGNWINDNSITVSIQFGKNADYKKMTKDEYEDDVYTGDPNKYIKDLFESSKGGSKK